jgi:hypothetical protein
VESIRPQLSLVLRPRYVIPGLLVISVTILYSLTLLTNVINCVSQYCDDPGEFTIALAQGGTVHPTGYPLYMLLGTPFVSALRAMGLSPAAGGSLFSLVWQVLAVGGVFMLVQRETHNPWLSGAAGLLLAVTRSMWIEGTLPEEYSLMMALSVWILWLAGALHVQWSDSLGWWLAFAGGLGAAHQRLVAVMLPFIGLWLLPQAWRSGRFWRWLGVACLCFAAGFLPYLDIPFRVWRGAPWLWSQADNWKDFWRVFWAGDYLHAPIHSLSSVLASARKIWAALRDGMGTAGVGLTVVGALIALIKAPRQAALWWGVGLSCLVFALFVDVIIVEAELMLFILCLVVVCAIGLAQLPRRWQVGASGVLLACGLYLGARQYPVVVALTHNNKAEQYIGTVEKLEAPPHAAVLALWGQEYFDLYYAQHFEGRLSQWQLVDHRADFNALTVQGDGRVYMSEDTLNVFTVDQWRQHLGSPLRITSAGPGMLAVTSRPLPAPAGPLYPIGDGIALSNWEVRLEPDHSLDLVAYWVATRTVPSDYSTYVHVTDKTEIVSADDLLGQNDAFAPVYSWYPTSQWQPNEVVREDHVVVGLPPDRQPSSIFVGMYRHEAGGQLTPLGHVVLDLEEGIWKMRAATPP